MSGRLRRDGRGPALACADVPCARQTGAVSAHPCVHNDAWLLNILGARTRSTPLARAQTRPHVATHAMGTGVPPAIAPLAVSVARVTAPVIATVISAMLAVPVLCRANRGEPPWALITLG